MSVSIWLVYIAPMLLVWAAYSAQQRRRRHRETLNLAALDAALRAGLHEPASLHPLIDASRCIGCGSCLAACPEQPEHQVLGLIDGKAQLISPVDCIGHGTCRSACPVGAITLVFGTEARGVDIPVLTPEFETNVAGIFIAGELGGMGLIKNALTQGRQAVEAIAARRPRVPGRLDLAIIGAGPAGFAATLTAKSLGLSTVTLEQESLGGAVFQYPRGKLVMTSPTELPLIGKIKFSQTSKEALLKFWEGVEERAGLKMNYCERVESIEQRTDSFVIHTTKGSYAASSVLLAIGRRGTPRKLGVPGEELPKVVYRLIDPEQYCGQRVLVVGGGDSALEAAVSIAESSDAHVAISYRGDAFGRAKAKNRERIEAASTEGRLHVILESNVTQIADDAVTLEHKGRVVQLPNTSVIVSAGGTLPTEFLHL